jgi:hypothetical protein
VREYGIDFEEGLRKGLRAFPNPVPGKEELIECYNLVPSPTGLVAHERIEDFDFSEFTLTPDPKLTGLRAYWKLEENGGPYADSVGDSDLVALESFHETNLTRVDGIRGFAQRAQQTGATQGRGSEGATCAHNSALNLVGTDFTINLWFKYSEWTGFGYFWFRKGSYDVSNTWPLDYVTLATSEWAIRTRGSSEGGRGIEFKIGNGTTGWPSTVICSFPDVTNTWMMLNVEYVLSQNRINMRISSTSGFEADTATGVVSVLTTTIAPVVLFNFMRTAESVEQFDLDEIGIWSRVLTLSERSQLWNSGLGRTYPFLPG